MLVSKFVLLCAVLVINLVDTDLGPNSLRFHMSQQGCLHGLVGSVSDYRSIPPEFESRHVHI